MTCGAALNRAGEHLACDLPHIHPNPAFHHNTTTGLMWTGTAVYTDSRISRDTRVPCDLTEPHPGLGHSNSEHQFLWTDGTDTTMTSTPATVEGKRALRNHGISDQPGVRQEEPTITVNRGGLQYTTAADEQARLTLAENVTINTWGAGSGSITVAGDTSAVAGTPQDLMDRARSMRDTYRSAGWRFTLTDQEDHLGRRIVIDAYLPNTEEN